MNKKDFVIGKYYMFIVGGTYLFKLKEVKDNKLFIDLNYYFINKKYYGIINDNSYINLDTNLLYTLVDIKDIIDLLPSNNPDKINYLRKQRIKLLLK